MLEHVVGPQRRNIEQKAEAELEILGLFGSAFEKVGLARAREAAQSITDESGTKQLYR